MLYVVKADNQGYNNRPENLKLLTKSDKQKRAVKRGRTLNYLKTADRSGWKKNYSTSKQVQQYDLDGNFIKSYQHERGFKANLY